MADDPRSAHPSGDGPAEREAGCGFQEATDLATRLARLGLETAATPLTWLPGPAREHLRHNAASALRGLAVGPRVLSGILEEVAREVQVPLEESHLGSRRRQEAPEEEPSAGDASRRADGED
ncbi:hypothetical protein [Thiohalorhabdus methylotrophus]|uniref:Uncharacterized protein n=1 Tax=Thiohalorhabdus methylotrophus TaxID=3242694 RepID=A0ABV4U0U8_9GAMM